MTRRLPHRLCDQQARPVFPGHGVTVLIGLCLLFVSSCTSSPPKSEFERSMQGATLSAHQVRSRLHDLVRRATAMIVAATEPDAQEIPDAEVRTSALRARANFVGSLQSAAFDNNPYVGFLDVWSLTVQTRNYYESGAGRDELGQHRARFLSALETIEELLAESVAATGYLKPMEDIQNTVESWAVENPILDSTLGRASVGPVFAASISGNRSIFGASSRLEDRVEDLSDRLTIYAESLPQQARWQAEILSQDLMQQGVVVLQEERDVVLAAVNQELTRILLALSEGRLAILTAIGEERAEILTALGEERTATVAALDDMHETTMSEVTAQRVATLEGLDQMRVDTILALRTERSEMQMWMDQSRVAMLEDVEQLAERRFDHMADRTEGVVTSLLDRILLAAGVGMGAVLIVVLIGVGVLARRRRAPA